MSLNWNTKRRLPFATALAAFAAITSAPPSVAYAQEKETASEESVVQEEAAKEKVAEKSSPKKKPIDKKPQAKKSDAPKPAVAKAEADAKASQAEAAAAKRLKAVEAQLKKLSQTLAEMQKEKVKEAPASAEGPTKQSDATDPQTADSKPEEPKPEQPKTEQSKPEATKTEATEPEKQKTLDFGVPEFQIQSQWLGEMPWRSLGPANMAGRITDLEVHAQDSSLLWVATAAGGILKTTNKGTTVEHQFDGENTVSIGAIASDPNNKNVIWVGTGEINPRNSVSYGDGVYKSVDGGKTWEHMGLKDTYQIGRILVHPKNADIVYVGAQGRLYGTNEDRGVYKTEDGGKTWKKVFYLDERTGVIDMIMHPEDPDTLIVGMWDRLRDGFDSWPGDVEKPEGIDGYDPIRKWGPKAGLYKTTDGGTKWKKLTKGLPSGMTGRIGLDWQSKSPNTIYAIIDSEDIGKGPEPFNGYLGLVGSDVDGQAIITQVMPDSPAEKAGVKVGDQLVSSEGETIYLFDELLAVLREKGPGERIKLALKRGDESLEIAPILTLRPGSRDSAPVPFLGVTGEDAEGGIKITKLVEDGPAALAGIKEGDLIASFEGESVKEYKEWIASIQKLAIGDEVALEVKRGEETLKVAATLAKKPGTGPRSTAIMGIQGEDAKAGGALLTSITEDGPSEEAGLKEKDIVVKVGDKEIKSYEALIAEIRNREAKDEMPVVVKRGEKTVSLTVVLGDRNAGGGDRPYTYSYYGQLPNVQDQQGSDGHEYGGVYKSTDAGESWVRVNSINVRPMYFSVIRVDPSDDQKVYLLGVSQFKSDNGGITFTSDFGRGVHSDCHDLWIDPKDGRHMVIGGDGGFYVTFDRGDNWDHINTAAIGQFYHVTIAPSQPYSVYGGLQDNGSWGGPAIGLSGGVLNQDWVSVGGGDGFVCRVDPEDTDLVYSESQNGSISRRNLRTGEGSSIRPPRVDGINYRFNWNTPFILSHHNSKIFYSAGNYVFRSYDRGDDLQIISPELTLTERGSATALSESPMDPSVLYVGTDDGALWVTQDGGKNWADITENLPVDPRWVATIEASRYEKGRVYVCLDGHRSDDDRPHAFISEDFGATFTELSGDLPRGSSRCLREDIVNPNLLFLGTEFAFWVSLDKGQTWSQFNQKLPTVAVHEVAMHPGVDDIVLATHGRSLWACDVTALRNLDGAKSTSEIALLDPADVIRWRRQPRRGDTNRSFAGQNPDRNAKIWYTLPEEKKEVVVKIASISGSVAEIKGNTKPGLHGVDWNMIQAQRGGRRNLVPNGQYRVALVVDGKEVASQVMDIKRDPTLAGDAISEQEFEEVMQELESISEEEESDGEAELGNPSNIN